MKQKREPIAIVGMACRFPGGCDTPDRFWNALENGRDLISSVGEDRWPTPFYYHPDPHQPGKSYTFAAGQIDRVYDFDAEFFGISPREAKQMDPQQRLLLELAWEAIEDAGHAGTRLPGSDCSVFVGISTVDYAASRFEDPATADAHFMTGTTLSIAANRISHLYDLRGPSMAIDTACSSSLVALHQACQNLWSGESGASIVASAHLLLGPVPFIGFSKASMLSPDGRCRVFAADANGYVRSEGGAVLILKPLSRATADGDPIHALILGTGVNSDGNHGAMTVPNGRAQQDLLSAVYAAAGVQPERLAYIEAHGTGTVVGDPIEAGSIGAVLGARHEREPLLVGSVKSNLGHLEPASGIAGLMKVVLSLQKRAVAPTINCAELNPAIPFDRLNLKVARKPVSLADRPGPLLMGVNSFGFGGSNAHAILCEYVGTAHAQRRRDKAALPPLLLSAGSAEALKQRARQFRDLIAATPDAEQVYAVIHNADLRLPRLRHGAAFDAPDSETLVRDLAAFADGAEPPAVVCTRRPARSTRLAFLYSGNGAQWAGMGRALLNDAEFRATIERIDRSFSTLAGWSILEELEADPAAARLDDTAVAQPLLFAVQLGLTAVLQREGIVPDAVAGHSVGEVAAACAAGALTLEEAVRVIYHRSRAQALARGSGRMAAVRLPQSAAAEIIERAGGRIALAGVNSPQSITLSGHAVVLEEAVSRLRAAGVAARMLDLDYAFHSPAMNSAEQEFRRGIGVVESSACARPFYSTVTGAACAETRLDAEYWWRNIREPVQFAGALDAMLDDGCNLFLEVGPRPVLQGYVNESLKARHLQGEVLATLRKDSGSEVLRQSLLRICLLHGGAPRTGLETPAPYLKLPPYPWNRSYFRVEPSPEAPVRVRNFSLLGWPATDVRGAWHNQLSLESHPFIADHVIEGAPVLPATAYADMALAASRSHFERSRHEVAHLEVRRGIGFDGGIKELQFQLDPTDLNFEIRSRPRLSQQPWTLNATGRLVNAAADYRGPRRDVEAIKAQAKFIALGRDLYRLAENLGIEFGESFRLLSQVWIGRNTILGTYALPPAERDGSDGFIVHPAWMDAAFHTLLGLFHARRGEPGFSESTVLPVAIGGLRHHGRPGRPHYCVCDLKQLQQRSVRASFALLDENGDALVELRDCIFRRMRRVGRASEGAGRFAQKLIPLPAAGEPGALPVACDQLRERVGTLLRASAEAEAERRWQRELLPQYEQLSVALAEQVLRELGAHIGEFTPESLMRSAGIGRAHAPLVDCLIDVLEQGGRLIRYNDAWKLAPGKAPDFSSLWTALIWKFPQHLPGLFPIAMRSFNLAAALTGRDPADSGAQDVSWHLQRAQSHGLWNRSVLCALEQLLETWPRQSRRIRVAEIGGNFPQLSDQMLALLPPDFCDYLVLTLDQDRHETAQRRLAAQPHVRVELLETALAADAAPEALDLLIVLPQHHEYRDLSARMPELRRLLARGGIVLVLGQRPFALINLLFGADPQWWQREPGTAAARPLLPGRDGWTRALEDAGFDAVCTLTEDAVPDAREFVLMARNAEAGASLPAQPEAESARGWLLISDHDGPSALLARELELHCRDQGERVTRAILAAAGDTRGADRARHIDPREPAGLEALDRLLRSADGRADHVVFLAGLQDQPAATSGGLVEKQAYRCLAAGALLDRLAAAERPPAADVWLVSRNGVHGNGAQIPEQAALWGFGRVAQNEYPGLNIRLVDLQAFTDPADAARGLAAEICRGDAEAETVLRPGSRHGIRLAPVEAAPAARADGGEASPFRLAIDRFGNFNHLAWTGTAREAPQAGELEIEVRAAGLNFRDVMYASGLLPDEMLDEGFAGPNLGLECAGVVTRVGEGVHRFAPGDRVIAFARCSFASHVVTPAAITSRIPDQWSFAAAATVPTAYFTVHYALGHLARLRRGERLLIHGAAGGVGLAAIWYARSCGAEIFATAGSPEKRQFLRMLGVTHVFNSRSLNFADQVLEITGGKGVDVVLNSLAGEAIDKSLSVLRPCGRFLELGKRDYFENTRIGLRAFRHNIAYFGVDADQFIGLEPEVSRELFAQITAAAMDGSLQPLPHIVFPAPEIAHAFRLMQHSHHVGKIVIDLAARPRQIEAGAELEPLRLRPDAAYLVTGGLGGFGFASADWLVQRGARHLVLLGRRGIPDEAAASTIAEWAARGINVQCRACDVTDAVALQRVLRDLREVVPPLRGIVHAAMTLDDRAIRNLDLAALQDVLRPKVQGAWNLHQLTLDMPLDFFVLYSSAAAVVGNPGQANYGAANEYLEALARFRRAAGLPALAVSWDAITDAGWLARNPAVLERLRKGGLNGVDSAEALSQLDILLRGAPAAVAVVNADWHRLVRRLPPAGRSRFDWLTHSPTDALDGAAGSLTAAELARLPPAEREQRLLQLMVAEVSQILELAEERIDCERPLQDIGVDSLMAMELASAVEARLGIEFPLMALGESVSLARLAEKLGTVIGDLRAAPEESAGSTSPPIAAPAAEADARSRTLRH